MSSQIHTIVCNQAVLPSDYRTENVLHLDYNISNKDSNVWIKLPNFQSNFHHIPDRILDLLEIASYVFAADRNTKRGEKNDVEFQSWSRKFHFHIKVRDISFWSNVSVSESLIQALVFLTGDNDYQFTFQAGHHTPPSGIFDQEQFLIREEHTNVVLFSGGLDSLAGVIEQLETTDRKLCLVSHSSGQTGTAKTQNKLFDALQRDYPNRCKHYKFHSSLKHLRAAEETQRTRSFLYFSIAFAISSVIGQTEFYVYENGITSLNFAKRQDLMNARASRTTHPKSLYLFNQFFNHFSDKPFKILHPFLFETKTDILLKLKEYGREGYIDSAISCSRTFKKDWESEHPVHNPQAPHCGGCSQCIDRRFAAYASRTEQFDGVHIYKNDFITQAVGGEAKITLVDYIRQAINLFNKDLNDFTLDTLEFLVDIIDYLEGNTEEEKVEKVYLLYQRHGQYVSEALQRMERPFEKIVDGSLLSLKATRDYLKQDTELLASLIGSDLLKALPMMFPNDNLPKNERDLNNKINALIEKNRADYQREYPTIRFGLANVVPDHAIADLLIETKYLRKGTSPSIASDGLAADMFKLPYTAYKLLVVYDPTRSINDDILFAQGFTKKADNCTVCIIR